MTRPPLRSWPPTDRRLREGSPQGDDGAADVETDLRWVWRLWAVVVVFALVAIWRSMVMGIPFRDPRGEWLSHRVAFTSGIVLVLVVVDGGWRSWQSGRSLRGTFGAIRRRWTVRRVALLLAGLAAYHTIYFSYHNLKSWLVFRPTHDDLLARWDTWLFLGHDPAALLHGLLGEGWATWALIAVYESFPSFVSFAFPAALVLADRMRHGYVYIASAAWVWIFGTLSYYAIPSFGPFHETPATFAALPHSIVTDTQAKYVAQRAYLLAHPEASDAAAQIAAFASLHVGVSTVIWLMLRYYGFRRIGVVWAIYLGLTMVATVYLGWHYVLDDIVGFAMAAAAVWLGIRTIYPRGYVDRSGAPARSELVAEGSPPGGGPLSPPSAP
ncbi:phosphatase PAP2 family protein [Nocardioides sp.]|uniref:phosphatase PAP2 family protein n=1 Tax=Nocardioides sp. TaxID=35761 RepID=UPI003527B16A